MFMGGLALGALIMSRFADRVTLRLRLYAFLEVCATVSALSIPWLLKLADTMYRSFFTKYSSSPTKLMFVQVIVSAAILLVPAMVMGSTLPLLGRYITSIENRIGTLVGKLYALNTLGATLGCFLAGFVLIRMFGVMGTLYIAAGINLLVAVGGWILSRKDDTAKKHVLETPHVVTTDAGSIQLVGSHSLILLLAFFMSGLISIGYELIWMRSIVFSLGGYTYVFSGVLTIYLMGNVIGAAIGSRLSRSLKNPAVGFGVSMTCLGVFGIIYIPALSTWSLKLAPYINHNLLGDIFKIPVLQSLGLPLYYSFFLFLLPSITMGIGFPLALQAWSKHHHKTGQTTGIVYGANTIGAVLGGIVAGFLLIPRIGTQHSITILGLFGIWLGIMMLQIFAAKISLTRRVIFFAAATAITVAALMIPAGLFEQRIIDRPNEDTLDVKEGLTTTVAVSRIDDGTLKLTSDGVNIAGDGIHRVAQKMLGHLGPFLNKNAQEVLSIGFGSGETTACLARHKLKNIDCVEIAPEVVEVALQYFGHINLGDKLHETVNMTYMDGKNYLYLTDKKYDVIINGADIPTYPGSAPMFGKEHFQNALEHLDNNGLFITKLHLHGIPKTCFDSIIGTFTEVFPHVTIWFPTTKTFSFFYLVGSNQEQFFSINHLRKQLKNYNVANSVSFLNWKTDLDMLTCYIGDQNDIARYLEDYNINSDYQPFVEFSFTSVDKQDLLTSGFAKNFIKIVRQDSILKHINSSELSKEQLDQWNKDRKSSYDVATHILGMACESDALLKLKSISKALIIDPEHKELRKQEDEGIAVLKKSLQHANPDAVLKTLDMHLRETPDFGTAWLIRSWALQRKNDLKNALGAAQKAVHHAPYSRHARENMNKLQQATNDIEAKLQYSQAIKALQNNKIDDAVMYFNKAIQLKPDWIDAMNNAAWLMAVYKDSNSFNPSRAIEFAQRACDLTKYKKPNLIDTLAVTYAASGNFDKAVEIAEKALEVAKLSQNEDVSKDIQNHLNLFRASKPYHESIK